MNLPVFLIPIVVGLIAQGLKPLINRGWHTHPFDDVGYMPRYGGMPSAHTAFAFSLATIAALADGFFSASFAIAVGLTIFILDDALRMRIFLGRHGLALQKLVNKLPAQERKSLPYLESHLGHKPLEAVVGAILGIVLTLVVVFFLSLT